MKVLVIDNGSISEIGNSYYTNRLNGIFLDELKSHGCEISYCQFVSKKANPICVFDLEAAGVACVPLKTDSSKVRQYCVAWWRLLSVICKHDFVYFYYPSNLAYFAVVCWVLRKDYGCYIRGMQGVEDLFSKWLYRHAKVVLTVADSFSDMVNNVASRSVAHTIRPMIPYSENDVVTERSYEKKQCYQILFLGRLDEQKGLRELLHAVKNLKERVVSRFELLIVGGGEFEATLKRLIADLELSDIVFLMGAVTDDEKKRQYYLDADLYVLPTYHEGFPRTLYEAMIFGTPIVTTFVGGISSVMMDDYNCKRIEPKSVDSIEEGLVYALNDYEQMSEYARNATKSVIQVLQRKSHAELLQDALS